MDPMRRSTQGSARHDLADPHASDSTPEELTIDRVAIPQEPARHGVLGEGLNDLLDRPFGGRMLRNPHKNDAPTVMGQQHQYEKHASGQCRHREEVQRHQRCQVIRQEGALRL